jgi:CheY-like chemotaxis protein
VLLVEDNPDGREMLRILMQLWGHDVAVAEDGIDGLRQALSWQPEVAVVDIGLPGLDGYEVARRVRDALADRVLLVALTGYCRPEDRRRAYEAGFDVHMSKPADLAELSRLVSKGPVTC